VRRKALSQGEAGKAWLAGLPAAVAALAAQWDLSPGRTLPGSTEAFVMGVIMSDGREAVLKLLRPGSDPGRGELNTFLAARGRGYAEVYAYDEAWDAMLIERLGPDLAELGWSTDAQIKAICATLREAWMPAPTDAAFMNGAEKANSLGAFIEAAWLELGRPCAEQTIRMARCYAGIRRPHFDASHAVLAHGDAHAWNTLLVPRSPGKFKFVDPVGLFIDRAYDLGILMREWTPDFLTGDPLTLGLRRCRLLAELTGIDPEPIWQWGFLERTANGLLWMQLGEEGAREMLAVADAWARGRI
jgi:streptomycin 6-kinase